MTIKYIPNIITVLRMACIVPFLLSLQAEHYNWAFYFFLGAGLTDGLDGLLARYCNSITSFGAFLDPLADKILLIVSYLMLGYLHQLPWSLVLLVLSRDIVIMMGATAYYFFIGKYEFAPTFISKVNTLLQVALVCAVLFELAFWPMLNATIQVLIIIVSTTTVISFIDYVWVWGQRAYREKHKQCNS